MASDAHDPTLDARAIDETAPGDSEPRAQTIAGRYRILGLLGVGGMGTVYRVHDTELDEDVALKMLRRDWIGAPGALARFKREVKIARRVTHRNVARTFDIGEHENEKFLTMELIDGPSLAVVLDERGALPVDEALEIAIEIARALEAAHAAGVVHRDLKPDNVLTDPEKRVVVTDFGIARIVRDDGSATTAIVGTPAYMAPEQVRGGAIDSRADLYALGLVLYEMLVGERAFHGESALAIASARLIQPAPDPTERRSGLPRDLVDLIRRLLSRDPESRPANAEDVETALVAIRSAATSLVPAEPASFAIPEVVRTIAVAPLRWRGEPSEAWIAEGFTEDLVDALCVVRGLRVKAGGDASASQHARSFGERQDVELVVDGGARKTPDGVAIRLRLTSVHDGFVVWAQRFECSLADVLMISDRVAVAVAEAAGQASPTPAARAAISPDAAELYLRGMQALGRGFMSQEVRPSHLFERALEIEPNDPSILSGLAVSCVAELFQHKTETSDLLRAGRAAAERALEIAPNLAEPWLALATVRHAEDDTPGALRALKRALTNGPSVARAHAFVGRVMTDLGRPDLVRTHSLRALWLDPSQHFARFHLIRLDATRGDWDGVEDQLTELAKVSPPHAVLSGTRMSLWAGRELLDFDRMPGPHPLGTMLMLKVLRRAVVDDDFQMIDSMIAGVDAHSVAARMFWQIRAEICMRVGRREEGLSAVRSSAAAGLEDVVWLEQCPLLADLRGDPLYAEVHATVRERAARALAAWDEPMPAS